MKTLRTTSHSPTCRTWLLAVILLLAVLVLGMVISGGCFHYEAPMPEAELDALVLFYADKYSLSPSLLKAVIWRESRFRPHANGKKGEIGLMQLLESGSVSDWIRVKRLPRPSRTELYDPRTNIEIGAWYLSRLNAQWAGHDSQPLLLLASYNAGCGTVERLWHPKESTQPFQIESITYPKTREYVRQILRKKEDYDKQGFGQTSQPYE